MRSVKKALAKGWSFGVKRIEGEWQNKRVKVEMKPTTQKSVETAEDSEDSEDSKWEKQVSEIAITMLMSGWHCSPVLFVGV